MAGYNEILTGRFNRALQKFFSMKGPASVNELSSIVHPSVGLFWGVENRYLENWNRFGQALFVNAAAANTGGIRFRNPSTSNVVAVVEKLTLMPQVANQAHFVEGWVPTSGDLAVDETSFSVSFDSRGATPSIGNVFSSVKLSQQNTNVLPALGFTAWELLTTVENPIDLITTHNQELTVLPGIAFQIRCNIVNTGLGASIWWRERLLEESERF